MRLFGSDRIMKIMERLGIEEDQPIEHSLVSRSIETAQKRVEAHNLEIRKHLLKYDDVMNKQREIIYAERQRALDEENLKGHTLDMIDDLLDEKMDEFVPPDTLPDEWNLRGLSDWLRRHLSIHARFDDVDMETAEARQIFERLQQAVRATHEDRERRFGPETMREIERVAILRAVDSRWKDHLYAMDLLKEGIGLRAHGGKDPLVEYKHEGYNLFSEMMADMKLGATEFIFRVQVGEPPKIEKKKEERTPEPARAALTSHNPSAAGSFQEAPKQQPKLTMGDGSSKQTRVPVKVAQKVGRNEPCPCGSGKKYKKCCGA
jgi:preprotein translocase subunit SecA